MTQDEIIEMARQAGIGWGERLGGMPEFLERFAKLVAQHEREACAKLAENTKAPFTVTAILARGDA
jgi:hypothetical protein